MSKEYDKYLMDHIAAVNQGCKWLMTKCEKEVRDILPDLPEFKASRISEPFSQHDASKYSDEEYEAYDGYFYGPDGIKRYEGASVEVQEAFNYAWLHHIHVNSHHWQHWLLVEDDGGGVGMALEMPDLDILEMICDWWSFSWRNGNLFEIFNWWNEHSGKILLGVETRLKVVDLLRVINKALLEEEE